MADAEYISVAGFIQFDPKDREVGDRKVRDIVIRQAGAAGQNVSVTLWPDFKDVSVAKGQFVAVEGKLTKNRQGDTTYYNLSCQRIFDGTTTIEAPKPGTENTTSSSDDDGDEPF